MAVAIIRFTYTGPVHSPFSGAHADTEVDGKGPDETVLFAYHGDATAYGRLSKRVRDAAEAIGVEPDDLEPMSLVEKLELPLVVVFEVDAEWNGVNTYAFAPLEPEK